MLTECEVVSAAPRPAWRGWVFPAVLVWATLCSFSFLWVPGYWGDEAATVTMASMPWHEFVAALRRVDAVHGVHYLAMRGWTAMFGFSPLSTRALSALAVALTSLAIVGLAGELKRERAGLFAAVAYPLLPGVLWMAGEARSYALSGLAATVMVWAGVRVWSRPQQATAWLVWVMAAVVGAWVFLFSIFALPVTLLMASPRRIVQHWRRLFLASVGVLLGVLPIGWLAVSQRQQVAWIPDVGHWAVGRQVLLDQFFGGEALAALVGWGLVVISVGWARHEHSTWMLVAWILLPTLILAATDVVLHKSFYQARYLSFAAPAVALLIGDTLTRLRPRLASYLVLGVLAAASWPVFADRLDANSKSSWLAVQEAMVDRVRPGDAWISFGPLMTAAENVYPEPWRDLVLLNPDPEPPWPTRFIYPRLGGDLTDCLRLEGEGPTRVWYLSDHTSRTWGVSHEQEDLALLEGLGYRIAWQSPTLGPVDQTRVYELLRE